MEPYIHPQFSTTTRATPRTKTYIFKVKVERDEDRWFAYCPVLESKGGATWGYTKEEALKNIDEVVRMVVESLHERGESIPQGPSNQVRVSNDSQVAVTL